MAWFVYECAPGKFMYGVLWWWLKDEVEEGAEEYSLPGAVLFRLESDETEPEPFSWRSQDPIPSSSIMSMYCIDFPVACSWGWFATQVTGTNSDKFVGRLTARKCIESEFLKVKCKKRVKFEIKSNDLRDFQFGSSKVN